MSQKTKDRATWTPLITRGELSYCFGRIVIPAPHVAPVMLLLLQTQWYVMNEERTKLWLLTDIENFFNSMIISITIFERLFWIKLNLFVLFAIKLLFFRQSRCSRQFVRGWLSDCCLMPIQQFFSYTMGRSSKFSMS